MNQSMYIHLFRRLLLLVSVRCVVDRLVRSKAIHLAFSALIAIDTFGFFNHNIVTVINLHRVNLLH